MSAALHNLGARLRAAHERRPVRWARYAPCLPLNAPVAVTIDHDDGQVIIRAHDGNRETVGVGEHALDALDALGVSTINARRTLVIADRSTASDLARIARDSASASAPVVAWWDQRADHPGTSAVHEVIATARSRWVLGVAPERERDLPVWQAWLGTAPGGGPKALLDLAHITSAGTVLPGLLEVVADADTRSWDYWCKRVADGWDWRAPDTRREAALGLATRAHATELFDSLRLGDPAVARREVFTGNVVPGVVTGVKRTRIEQSFVIEADAPLSRLRVGARVGWWPGDPGDGSSAPRTGRIAWAGMDAAGVLSVQVQDVAASLLENLATGQRVTLRPAPVNPHVQQRARANMARRYNSPGNWVAGRGAPAKSRTDVPLDVVLAAAEDY